MVRKVLVKQGPDFIQESTLGLGAVECACHFRIVTELPHDDGQAAGIVHGEQRIGRVSGIRQLAGGASFVRTRRSADDRGRRASPGWATT
jgi:hypothetical protein